MATTAISVAPARAGVPFSTHLTADKPGPGGRRSGNPQGGAIITSSPSGRELSQSVATFPASIATASRFPSHAPFGQLGELELMKLRAIFATFIPIMVIACGGGSNRQSSVATTPPTASGTAADITMLFMGNSHTSVNNIPGMVATLVGAGRPGKTVAATEAPAWMHLEERADDATSLALLQSQRWSHVILQAQNYSLSGQTFYPTAGAEKLVRLSRQAGALPVLFPEWPRLGIAETQIIYDKYVSVAMKAPACVPPIPQAFDLARARFPAIILHNADGNHSAPPGAFLASLVLYAAITGASPVNLPALSIPDVDADMQEKLRNVANETVQTIAPRLWCPADRPD